MVKNREDELVKFKIKQGVKWLPKGKGVVLYPYVLFEGNPPAEGLVRHEFEHCYQIARMGRLRFYAYWLWYTCTRGYKDNPLEEEARAAAPSGLNDEELAAYWAGELSIG